MVLLDFDGTIADTGPGISQCVEYAAAYFGKQNLTQEEKKAFVGPPLKQSFAEFFGLEGDDIMTAIAKYRECYNAGAMYNFTLYDGIRELVKELNAAGIKVVMASSKPAVFVNRILEHLGMSGNFDYIACPAADGVDKSKYEMIAESLEHFGTGPEKAVMVGDRHFDIEGAKAAGVYSIGAAYGYGTEEELVSAGADFIAKSVSDISSFVF